MVSLHVVSDIHLETRDDLDVDLLPPIDVRPTILILAGDISESGKDLTLLKLFLEYVMRIYDEVIYVPGNYEYIKVGKTLKVGRDIINLCRRLGIIFLEDDFINLYGITFYGTNLWSYLPPEKDFSSIREVKMVGQDERNALHGEALSKLEKYLHLDPIVISHYPPTMYFTETKHPDSSINDNYGNHLEFLVKKLWICGHSHYSDVLKINGANVVSNCYGRLGEKGCNFNDDLIIDL